MLIPQSVQVRASGPSLSCPPSYSWRLAPVGSPTHIRSGMQHGTQAQNRCDEFLRPYGPVERIIGIVARLRRKDDLCRLARAVLQDLGRDGIVALNGFVV